MKSNKIRMTLTAAVVGLSMVTGACASPLDQNESTVGNGYKEVQPTSTSTTVAPAADTYSATEYEPDYLTVHEAIDIVGNGGSIKPGDMKATTDIDKLFIAYLKGEGIHLSEDEALRSAATTCSFLMQGGDTDQLWAEIAVDPYSPDIIPGVDNASKLPTLMGAATGAYCSHLG